MIIFKNLNFDGNNFYNNENNSNINLFDYKTQYLNNNKGIDDMKEMRYNTKLNIRKIKLNKILLKKIGLYDE